MTILITLLGGVLLLELLLELTERVTGSWRNHQPRPHYPWSFCSTAGRYLTSERGSLKLSVYPMSLYRNLPSQQTEWFHINSSGFRGPELKTASSVRRRLILLGGSTAFGTGLDDDTQTIAAYLESMLDNAEVVNAAVIGFQSGQELAYYVKDLMDLRPDTVIALNGWNDFSQILHTSGKGGLVLPPRLMGFNWFTNMERALVDYSAIRYGSLVRRLALLVPLLFPRLWGTAWRLTSALARRTFRPEDRSLEGFQRWIAGFEHEGPQADYFNAVVDSYANHTTLLRDIAASRSTRFLCVMQSPRSDEPAAGLYRSFTHAVMDRLATSGVHAINLCGDPNRPRDALFLDSIHLDPTGCREVASLIASRLTQTA